MRIELPKADGPLDANLMDVLKRRRSVRTYGAAPLALLDAARLLFATQGVTGKGGKRAAPSAGATFPLETYLVAGAVEDLAAGVYRYRPGTHALERTLEGDRRADLGQACLGQACVTAAPASLVLAAVYARTARNYGERAIRYVALDAGHAAQNFLLMAEALGLASVPVGAFDDEQLKAVLHLPPEESPIYVLPAGHHPGR